MASNYLQQINGGIAHNKHHVIAKKCMARRVRTQKSKTTWYNLIRKRTRKQMTKNKHTMVCGEGRQLPFRQTVAAMSYTSNTTWNNLKQSLVGEFFSIPNTGLPGRPRVLNEHAHEHRKSYLESHDGRRKVRNITIFEAT
jgi:hypothetical protein